MGKEWSIPAKQEEKKVTVIGMLTEISDEICDHYCKYPEICEAERKDPDEAEQLLYDTYCANCPLSRM